MNILHTENDQRRTQYLDYARNLLLEFIRDSSHILGASFVVYTLHMMSHIRWQCGEVPLFYQPHYCLSIWKSSPGCQETCERPTKPNISRVFQAFWEAAAEHVQTSKSSSTLRISVFQSLHVLLALHKWILHDSAAAAQRWDVRCCSWIPSISYTWLLWRTLRVQKTRHLSGEESWPCMGHTKSHG